MRTTIYKRLFEVRIFHDYFLSKADGTPFSAMKDPEQKAFLEGMLARRRYEVQRFLKIEPSPEMKIMLNNYRMRMVPTPLGFFIGLEVRQSQNAGTLYEPFIALNDKVSMTFLLEPGDELFYNYSNLTLQDVFPARWYFTNQFVEGEKAPDLNVLSALVPAKDAEANYEMGELIKEGDQMLEAYLTLNETPAFLKVKGDGYVTRRDRFLLPKRFDYDLGSAETEAVVFSLIKEGAEVKTVQKAAEKPARFVHLNFEKQDDEAKTPIPDGAYTLRVSGRADRKVMLRNGLYDKDGFGAIEIFPFADKPGFNLLDDNGKLLTRIDEQGNKQPHPVFELRFTSRKAYWRYRSKEAIDEAIIEKYKGFLRKAGDSKMVLVTKKPKAFSHTLSHFAPALIPPQPSPYLLRKEAGRYFTDIQLSRVSQFQQD